MTQTYRTHVVAHNDSIESIAQRHLGSAMRWREIVALNKLRAPFVSNKPADWFGPVQATGILAFHAATNERAITIVGERPEVLQPSGVFFVDGYDQQGQYLYEALPIREYDPATGDLGLFLPFRYSWPSGTRWVVFRPQRDLDSRVARPGEAIVIPVAQGSVGAVLVTEADLIHLYGIDIELRPGAHGGRLAWENGDLVTVRGRANIHQALRMKADLPKGMNLFHPDQGNRTHELVGDPATPDALLRARNYTADALARDPRVVGITSAHAAIDEDTITVTTQVELANSTSAVRVDAVIIRR